jgi:ribosomal-protein-alanine N-acetyltransferase
LTSNLFKRLLIRMISSKTPTLLRAASMEDHQKLAYLVHFDSYIHRHLDYRPPLDWLGEQPFTILEDKDAIVAALACPADPPQVAWIRMFAAAYHTSIADAWNTLWPAAQELLRLDPKILWAAAIPLHDWFENLLIQSQFQITHSIVMLNWEQQQPPPYNPNTNVNVRPMSLDDLPTVQMIDQAAFVPVWQNSLACLEYAYRQAAIAAVVERDGQLLGYQISTPTHLGGHLARLAVLPEHQNQGLGYALLHDLLSRFARRGARLVTVNTQKENLASLALYRRTGFQVTGEEYPIYQYNLSG